MQLLWGGEHGNQSRKGIGRLPTDSTSFCQNLNNRCNLCTSFPYKTTSSSYFYLKTSNNALTCKSLESALQLLQGPPYLNQIENVWIIGGASVYKVTIIFLNICHYVLMLTSGVLIIRKQWTTRLAIAYM